MKFIQALLFLMMIVVSTETQGKATRKKLKAEDIKWNKLMSLILNEERTIKGMRNLGPRLRYRLLELNGEKLRLIKEKENKKFLNANYKTRKSLGRKFYFRESVALYKKTRRQGLAIIKKWPRFRNNAAIYYTLALNSRDYGGDKQTEYFLHYALKNSRRGEPIVHLAKTSLAEYYYNKKKYKKAIRYYKDVLKNKGDEWYSKHLYNVAWCYLKTQKYNDAIESLKSSFAASKKEDYIDVSEQVLQGIGTFFVMGKRVEEGAEFYVKNEKEPGAHLIKMAKKTADNGSFKQSRFLLKTALENSRDKKNIKEEIEINLSELEFYRNFKRPDLFLETSFSLQKLNSKKPFNMDQKEEAVQKIKSFVGYQQVKLSKNNRIDNVDYNQKDLEDIITYFNILASINPKNTDQYKFFQGESYFAVMKYKDAIEVYRSSLELQLKGMAKKKKIVKGKKAQKKVEEIPEVLKKVKGLKRKTMNSMLACLENGEFKKEFKKDFTTYTYQKHLDFWPVDPVSQVLYQKLFNLYMKDKMIPSSHKTLEAYIKHYPKDREIQRAMFTQEMDHYIKTKDSNQIASWINKMNTGFIGIQKDYIEKATLILGHILFENYQKFEKENKYKEAIEGYASLYNDKRYPRKIKSRSSMKMAIDYIELKNVEASFKWLKISMGHHTKEEAYLERHKVRALTERYAGLLDFKIAAESSRFALLQFCSKTYKSEKIFFDQMIHFNLLEKEYESALKDINMAYRCNIKTRPANQTREKIILFAIKNRHYRTLFSLYKKFGKKKKFISIFDKALVEVYWDSRNNGKSSLTKSVRRIIKKAAKSKTSNFIVEQYGHIHLLDSYLKKNGNPLAKMIVAKKKFNEKSFNSQLEQKIKGLNSLTEESKELIKSGHPELILAAYAKIIKGYENAIKTISAYSPKGVPQDFVKAFKGQMKGLTNNLEQQKTKQLRLAKSIIKKNKIFSPMVYAFGPMRELASTVKWHYPSHGLAIPMDKMGGQRE